MITLFKGIVSIRWKQFYSISPLFRFVPKANSLCSIIGPVLIDNKCKIDLLLRDDAYRISEQFRPRVHMCDDWARFYGIRWAHMSPPSNWGRGMKLSGCSTPGLVWKTTNSRAWIQFPFSLDRSVCSNLPPAVCAFSQINPWSPWVVVLSLSGAPSGLRNPLSPTRIANAAVRVRCYRHYTIVAERDNARLKSNHGFDPIVRIYTVTGATDPILKAEEKVPLKTFYQNRGGGTHHMIEEPTLENSIKLSC